jgi:hypothetical protein
MKYLVPVFPTNLIKDRRPIILMKTIGNSPGRRLLTSYTIVYMPYTLCIRPYFAIKHVIVLRSYLTVTVYGEIWRNTEIVYGAYMVCIRSYTVSYTGSFLQKLSVMLLCLTSVDAVDHQQAASIDGDDISESTSGSGRVLINPCMINKFDIIQKWLQYCPNFEKLYQLHEGTLNNFTFFNSFIEYVSFPSDFICLESFGKTNDSSLILSSDMVSYQYFSIEKDCCIFIENNKYDRCSSKYN